jgi:hypothetical protein
MLALSVGILITMFCVTSAGSDATSNATHSDKISECGLYLAPSTNQESGRGIIAGKFIVEDQLIHQSASIAISEEEWRSSQINNYVVASHEDGIAVAELGLDMLYNHRSDFTMKKRWESSALTKFDDQKLAHTTYSSIISSVATNITGKQKIFLST